MNDLVTKLNEVLADEWACVRALRRAETQCDDPGRQAVINRVRKECSVNCVNLTNVVRNLNGRPTDVPSARFSLKLAPESLDEALDMAQAAQRYIIDEIAALIDESELKTSRSQLAQILQVHKDDLRWLDTAMGR